MEESDKLPLKRVELSLSKFNEVAIPHHLDLLRQHRANIIKHSASGARRRVLAEQGAAARAAARLRALLAELEALRARVRDADLPHFDARTQRSRDLTHAAIMDYLETRPARAAEGAAAGSVASAGSVGVLPLPDADADAELQLHVDEQELSMQEREELLRGWSALQGEVRALHDVWQHAHAAALQQRAAVDVSAARAQQAACNVEAASSHLSVAERLRGSGAAWGGACVGLLAGGPAGLALGAKAGAAAALAGSLLGYLGARALPARLPAPDPRPKAD